MGGLSTGRDDEGALLSYGDVCEVDTSDGKIAAKFIETADDGTRWFECICEKDSIRASDVFPDYYQEVYWIKLKHGADDPSPWIGHGI